MMERVKTDEKHDILKGDDTRYDSAHDANMRLAKTIIRFNGSPVFVKECLPDMWVVCWDTIENSTDFMVHCNDKRLDISSPPLGFINYNSSAIYSMRNATRSQKQGIDATRLAYLDVYNGPRAFNASGDLLMQIGCAIRSEYPDFLEGMHGAKRGFAISRTWGFCITKDKNVLIAFHKQYPVALLRVPENRFIFQKGELTKIRRESLQNVLVKKGKPGANYRVEESA